MSILLCVYVHMDFPSDFMVKNPPANAGATGDPGSGQGQEDPLEEAMGTHASSLARIIPWTEEPGRILTGSQIVRRD